jgi:hypothetical protein
MTMSYSITRPGRADIRQAQAAMERSAMDQPKEPPADEQQPVSTDKLERRAEDHEPSASSDRRTAGERRNPDKQVGPPGSERRQVVDRRSGLDRRRGPGRRRSEERRTAEEGEMNEEQFEFIMAINEYKRVNRRPFPTWTEVLDVMKALGYRKVAERGDIR